MFLLINLNKILFYHATYQNCDAGKYSTVTGATSDAACQGLLTHWEIEH